MEITPLGTDARSLRNVLSPENSKCVCWIKSDPTFEGLRQIFFEPESRVKIQPEKPEQKEKYSVINSVRFLDTRSKKEFPEEKILLNQNLNSIIGGKSSGKSLLLYHIAKTIDPERIESINKEKGNHHEIAYPYEKDPNFDFEVEWDDGKTYKLKDKDKPNRSITFIPQLYLNRLAEDQKAELNALVEKMLIESSPEYKLFHSKNRSDIELASKEMFEVIDEYYILKANLDSKRKELRDLGDKAAIEANVNLIEAEIEKLKKESSFSDEEEANYTKLVEQKRTINKQHSELSLSVSAMIAAKEELNLLKGKLPELIRNEINRGLKTKQPALSIALKEVVEAKVQKISEVLQTTLTAEVESHFKSIEQDQAKIIQTANLLIGVETQLLPMEEKVKNKDLYASTQKRLESEQAKLQQAKEKESEIQGLLGSLSVDGFVTKYAVMFRLYLEIVAKNKEHQSIPDTDNLELSSEIKINNDEFNKNFCEIFDRRKSMKEQLGNFFDDKGNYAFNKDTHVENIRVMIEKIVSGSVALRTGFVEKIVMLSLLNDYFSVDYNLLQDGDELIKMSPGKRGIILFQLFLHLSKSSNPILIDQPEDNLDNRTVYQELNDFIKTKKSIRQIIIVSHNPNLVVSTDSENIIVVNQGGQNKSGKNRKYHFEYVNGAIEHSFKNPSESDGVLFQSGIREHVCDILEGGTDAFEKRESKYGFK